MWVAPPETFKNTDVFGEPTGMYSRRVSGGGTHSAAIVWHGFTEFELDLVVGFVLD